MCEGGHTFNTQNNNLFFTSNVRKQTPSIIVKLSAHKCPVCTRRIFCSDGQFFEFPFAQHIAYLWDR